MGGAAGMVGMGIAIAGIGIPEDGGAAPGAAGAAGGAALDPPPITRVNSPGPAGAAGGALGGACRGSKLSVKAPGGEIGDGNCAGGVGAAGGTFAPRGAPPRGVPPPKIRVNSPGVLCDGELTGIGSGSRDDSEGGASGLRNSLVNSPG
jgi:hypothetical protein